MVYVYAITSIIILLFANLMASGSAFSLPMNDYQTVQTQDDPQPDSSDQGDCC